MTRILVTGAHGQLGHDLMRVCAEEGDDVTGVDLPDVDVTSRSTVHDLIGSLRPDVVIHGAAMTAVDRCEAEPDAAFAANALAVRWVREACDSVGAHLAAVSTDYVFDGTLERPYHEWDTPNPASVYGASKLGGEREAGPEATIVRTAWVCGEHGNNMVRTVVGLVDTHDSLTFVDDQRGCPTFTTDLAPVVRRLAVERRRGLHHVTNQRAVSWFEFVREIVGVLGRDPEMVSPISTAQLDPPRPAPRPANSVLDNAVLRLSGEPPLRDHAEPLRELIARLRPV